MDFYVITAVITLDGDSCDKSLLELLEYHLKCRFLVMSSVIELMIGSKQVDIVTIEIFGGWLLFITQDIFIPQVGYKVLIKVIKCL